MSTKEVENSLVWEVQCQECEANLSAKGIKSIPLAEDFMTKHSEEMGHTLFDMDVFAHTICVKVIDAGKGKGEPCGMN